jgi:acyl-coenzyme A synthetase/AMP-(fatty) acid ligase
VNPLQQAYSEPAYRTGDIVRLESDGLYYFVGRRDHMVKCRGYRIELGDIEQALHQHERVKEAIVVALPSEEFGNTLHAAIAPVDGATVNATELTAFLSDRIPRYMVPETYFLRDELPKTSTGKIDRVSLRQQIHGQQQETSAQ